MDLNRRNALFLLAGTALCTLTGCDHDEAGTSQNHDSQPSKPGNGTNPLPNTVGYKIRSSLVGYGAAYNLSARPATQIQTIQLLGHLAHQRDAVDTGKKTPAQAANDIRFAISSGPTLDPTTFDSSLALFKPEQGDLGEALDFARVLSAGTYSGLGLLVAPEGVAAVMLLGALMSATDIALSKLPDLLQTLELPPMSTDQLAAVTTWTVKQSVSLTENSAGAKQVAANLFASGTLPIDLNQTPEGALKSLPPGVQKVASPYISQNPSNPNPTIADSIKKELHEGLDRVDKSTDKIINLLTTEKNLYVRAILEARQQSEIRNTASDLEAVGIIGGGILKLFGDPIVGNQIRGLATIGSQIYTTIASSGLGGLTIAGNLFTAANNLVNLFGGGADPLLDALKPIYAKLNQISLQLDVIASQQKQILAALAQLYQVQLQNSVALQTIQGQLATLATDSSESNVATERVFFDNSKNELATLLTNNAPASIAKDINLKSTYDSRLTDCYTFATVTARSNNEASNASTPLDNVALTNLIRSRGRCDRLVGLLPKIGAALGIQLPAATGARIAGPVCPTAWAEGVNSYLEARCRAAVLSSQAEAVQLQEMWSDGQYLRQLIIAMTSPETLDAARKQLRKAAGFPDGEINSSADIPGSTLLQTVYSVASSYVSQNVSSSMVIRGGGGPQWGVPNDYVVVEPDYFQNLLNRGLVVLESCAQHPGYNSGFNDCYARVVADGPYKQLLLVPGKIMATRPYEYSGGVGAVEAKSQQIWRGAVERPQIQAGMPTAISQALSASNFPDFEYWGEVTRLLSAFINWRLAPEHSVEAMLLANIIGPYKRSEVSSEIEAYVHDALSFLGDWPLEVARALDKLINVSLENSRVLSARILPNRSVMILDDTFRRLTGYMLSRNISLPV